MKIKTKLTLGVGLLFTLILLLSVVSAKNLFELKSDTENVLVANYRTLEYSRNILTSLEMDSENALDRIEENLKKQEQNITEINELEVTQDLRNYFEKFKTNPTDTALRSQIRKVIYNVMDMNMQAIQRKSELAEKTEERAVFWIAITGTGCFVIAFILLVNIPSNIANPIKELSESIRQIADKNYAERVHFESNSEFGELARSFNAMAQKLEEYDSSNLAKLMIEKKRIETLIDKMHDPVIGLDEGMHIIFANEEASQILGLNESELIVCRVKSSLVHLTLFSAGEFKGYLEWYSYLE